MEIEEIELGERGNAFTVFNLLGIIYKLKIMSMNECREVNDNAWDKELSGWTR